MFNTIHSDLIRGHIDTIILKSLFQRDRYGYEICKEIEGRSSGQYQLKQPTLYSCLKRLEIQGFISAYWGEKTNGGRRKYYTLTELGRNLFIKNQTEWEYSRTVIDQLISDRRFNLDALPPVNTAADNIDVDNEKNNSEITETSKVPVMPVIMSAGDPVQAEALATVDSDNNSVIYEHNFMDSFIEKGDEINRKNLSINTSYLDSLLLSEDKHVKTPKERTIEEKFTILNNELFSDNLSNEENIVSKEFIKKPSPVSYVSSGDYFKPAPKPVKDKDYNERDYKTVLNKLFNQKEKVKTEPPEEKFEKIEKEEIFNEFTDTVTEKNNDTGNKFVNPEPDFIIIEDTETINNEFASNHHNRTGSDNSETFREYQKNSHENIFNNIDSEEYETNTRHKDSFRIKAHNKSLNKDYSNQFYVYGNKLRSVNFLITGLLMLLETTIMLIAFSAMGLNKAKDNTMYVFAYILPVFMIIIGFVIYKLHPTQKQRAQFNLTNNLIFYFILFLMSVMFVILVNLVANMTIYNYKEYLVSILVPAILSTNFIVGTIIHYGLYRSKKYSV